MLSASSLTAQPLFRVIFSSDLVPDDLIGIQMQRKAASVPFIYHSILRFIGIVDYTVFSVLHIGMYFHIVVLREPSVQILLIVG